MEESREVSRSFIQLADIMFAVIISSSLVSFFDALRGGATLNAFSTYTLLASYVSVVLSWIGYHRSIQLYPHRGTIGTFRFILDLTILFGYLVLVYFYETFAVIVATYPLLFLAYLLWGCLKMWEHDLWKKQWVRYILRFPSLVVSVIILALWHVDIRLEWPYPGWDFLYLFLLVLCIVWYRFAPILEQRLRPSMRQASS